MKILAIVLLVLGSYSYTFGQDDAKSIVSDGNTAYMEKQYAKALEKYESALQIGIPDSIDKAWVLGYAALCSEELNQPEKAKTFYTQAIQYGYPNPTIYNKMVAFCKKNNDNAGQEFALINMKKMFSDEAPGVNNRLVALYNSSKEYEKLSSIYDELISKDSTDYKLYSNKATVLGQLQKLNEAKTYYLKALSLKPDDQKSNMYMGLMIYNEGTVIYDREKNKYNKLTKPTQSNYIQYQRNIKKGKDLYLEAEPYLLKSYSAQPDPSVKKALFAIYDRTEQPAKAQKYK